MESVPNRQTATHRLNRFIEGDTLAILLCPGPMGCTVGVTIDREDLKRVLAVGLWRVGQFPAGLYCYFAKGKGNTYLHRFILSAPKGQVVDHEKHRTLDNRKSEIRLCSQGVNQLNRIYGGHGISGYRGVFWKRGKWEAKADLNNKRHYLGRFTDPAIAAEKVRQFLIENGAAYAAGAHA